eukprot:3605241-Prymnesium_polylepis.1
MARRLSDRHSQPLVGGLSVHSTVPPLDKLTIFHCTEVVNKAVVWVSAGCRAQTARGAGCAVPAGAGAGASSAWASGLALAPVYRVGLSTA